MKIDYKHPHTKQESYFRINNLLTELQKQYSDKIKNPQVIWNPNKDRMDFSMEILEFKTNGEICLKDYQVSLNGKIPFMAGMFSGKIEKIIRDKLADLLS